MSQEEDPCAELRRERDEAEHRHQVQSKGLFIAVKTLEDRVEAMRRERDEALRILRQALSD